VRYWSANPREQKTTYASAFAHWNLWLNSVKFTPNRNFSAFAHWNLWLSSVKFTPNRNFSASMVSSSYAASSGPSL
jgi:hypothetical protein